MREPDIESHLDPRAGSRYRARVKLRRGAGWKVKPEAELDDGKEAIVRFGWRMNEEDTSVYVGEAAWVLEEALQSKLGWLASGDLEFLEEMPARDSGSHPEGENGEGG